MDKKYFVLDTNILLDNPDALFTFNDNIVILTEAVLEELDSFKKDKTELGIAARKVTRNLEKLRLQGSLLDGVKINNDGIIKVEINHNNIELPANWSLEKADHRILQVCKALRQENKNAFLITNDILLRIKSDIINIPAEGFRNIETVNIDSQYTGRLEAYIDDNDFDKFYQNYELEILKTSIFTYDNYGNKKQYNLPIYPHEFVLLKNSENSSALGKVDNSGRYIHKLNFDNYCPFGIIPKNIGQRYMIEALMNDVPLTIIRSVAGAGKTLFALAAGLERTMEKHEFRKILICPSVIELGGTQTIGFLPGTEQEKIAPHLRNVKDNLEILVDSNDKERYSDEKSLKNKVQYILDNEYIEFQAVAFLRGRSIAKQYIIIEEAQNMNIAQMTAIVTRVGEGTKLILCGDPQQIDSPFLSTTNNGLSWISERMKGSPYCIQLALNSSECIRSKLAKDVLQRIN